MLAPRQQSLCREVCTQTLREARVFIEQCVQTTGLSQRLVFRSTTPVSPKEEEQQQRQSAAQHNRQDGKPFRHEILLHG